MTQRLWGYILLSVLVLHGGCSRKQPVDIRELVPEMSEEMAGHLTEDNEDTFRKYTAEAGLEAVSRAMMQMVMRHPQIR